MSGGTVAIDELNAAFLQMREALDSENTGAMFEASRIMSQAILRVKSHGSWQVNAELREHLTSLLPLIEEVRVRVNLASDHVRERISMISDRGGADAKFVYSR
jgi:plasmid stability protein